MRLVACVILLALSSCAGGPKVSPCILDPHQGIAYCAPSNGDDVFDLEIDEMENFACFSPNDTRAILEFIKRKGNRNQSTAATNLMSDLREKRSIKQTAHLTKFYIEQSQLND